MSGRDVSDNTGADLLAGSLRRMLLFLRGNTHVHTLSHSHLGSNPSVTRYHSSYSSRGSTKETQTPDLRLAHLSLLCLHPIPSANYVVCPEQGLIWPGRSQELERPAYCQIDSSDNQLLPIRKPHITTTVLASCLSTIAWPSVFSCPTRPVVLTAIQFWKPRLVAIELV
jgi:hypothetical protein